MAFTAAKGFIHFSKDKYFSTIETHWDIHAQLADVSMHRPKEDLCALHWQLECKCWAPDRVLFTVRPSLPVYCFQCVLSLLSPALQTLASTNWSERLCQLKVSFMHAEISTLGKDDFLFGYLYKNTLIQCSAMQRSESPSLLGHHSQLQLFSCSIRYTYYQTSEQVCFKRDLIIQLICGPPAGHA